MSKEDLGVVFSEEGQKFIGALIAHIDAGVTMFYGADALFRGAWPKRFLAVPRRPKEQAVDLDQGGAPNRSRTRRHRLFT